VKTCGTFLPTQSEGSTTSTGVVADAIGYIPSLAYSNVFSIFYLEIISITKLISGKNKSDSYIGIAVNCAIFIFYFILFLLILLFQITGTENDLSIEVLFIKQWYSMQNPFKGVKSQMTIFDFSQALLVVILFIHCLMNLFIAKESACIFWNELKNEALSKCLDDKSKSTN
jgi:uncharacterized protein YggT (Ycf19 family)